MVQLKPIVVELFVDHNYIWLPGAAIESNLLLPMITKWFSHRSLTIIWSSREPNEVFCFAIESHVEATKVDVWVNDPDRADSVMIGL